VTHGENLAHRGAFQRGRLKVRKKIYQYTLDGVLINTYGYNQETKIDVFRPNGLPKTAWDLLKPTMRSFGAMGYSFIHRGIIIYVTRIHGSTWGNG